MSRPDKPHIAPRGMNWIVQLRGNDVALGNFASACMVARMIWRGQMIGAAGREAKRIADAPPLTPERAQEVLARQAEWEVRHRVADRPFGWGYIGRDVGAELTDEEHTALQRFFDGDPRRPVITERVRICAREDFLPENFLP